MNRQEWQQTAEDKLLSARILLAASHWAMAYYLAGYSIECGLKSCIIRRLAANPEIIFEHGHRKFSEDCWTHNIVKLLEHAGLKPDLDTAKAAQPTLEANWVIVCQWNENCRYERKSQVEAQALCDAINNPKDGVMQWIRTRW